MENIAVVTDSTSDISREEAAANNITVIPLLVTHKGAAYEDGIDITPETFYPLLQSSSEVPKTSQPSPEQFRTVYESLLGSAKEIISLHISQGLSSTVATAKSVADQFFKGSVHVVDSAFLSYALAFQAKEAVRLARENLAASEVLERLAKLREKSELLFSLETLHYLQIGGRIGKVSAMMGNILGVKPVIRVEDGVYISVEKARNMKRALQGIVDYIAKTYGRQKLHVAVGHGQGAGYAATLRELVSSRLRLASEISMFQVGPVIGVHTGPGTVGLATRPAEY